MSDREPIYEELRGNVLGLDPATVGLEPSGAHPRVWGVVMDLGYPEGTASLVGLSDGTTSLYTSSGGGTIGGGEHERVAAATDDWLQVAEEVVDELDRATEFPLPPAGRVAFALLTYEGGYRSEVAEDELERTDTPLGRLYDSGHAVITELRQVEERVETGT